MIKSIPIVLSLFKKSRRTMADYIAKPKDKMVNIIGVSSDSREHETALQEAARALEDGGLIGVPTDTIYGIACLASMSTPVKNIYELKGKLPITSIFSRSAVLNNVISPFNSLPDSPIFGQGKALNTI